MSFTIKYESGELQILPEEAVSSFCELMGVVCRRMKSMGEVDFNAGRVLFYDSKYRLIHYEDDMDMVEYDFVHVIIVDENMIDFCAIGPQHVIATWPWKMDAEGEAWLAHYPTEDEEHRAYQDAYQAGVEFVMEEMARR